MFEKELDTDLTVYYQPTEEITVRAGYQPNQVWRTLKQATIDCNCTVRDIKRYTGQDIDGYRFVGKKFKNTSAGKLKSFINQRSTDRPYKNTTTMHVNNDLKVTPGYWETWKGGILDSNTTVNADGTKSEYNIASLSDENPDYEWNKKAIIAAVNFFKSIGIEELKEQKEYVVNEAMNRKDERQGIYEGLTHLLDAIQDTLVDDFGADEYEVFNLTIEEE